MKYFALFIFFVFLTPVFTFGNTSAITACPSYQDYLDGKCKTLEVINGGSSGGTGGAKPSGTVLADPNNDFEIHFVSPNLKSLTLPLGPHGPLLVDVDAPVFGAGGVCERNCNPDKAFDFYITHPDLPNGVDPNTYNFLMESSWDDPSTPGIEFPEYGAVSLNSNVNPIPVNNIASPVQISFTADSTMPAQSFVFGSIEIGIHRITIRIFNGSFETRFSLNVFVRRAL